jgi:hypothetical protein
MNTYNAIAEKIVKEQEQIIGPIAWKEAEKVVGVRVDASKKEIYIDSDPLNVIDKLVVQFERFFGQVSHEVCRDAARELTSHMKPEEVPESLR